MAQLRIATFNLENFDETADGERPSLAERIALMRPQIVRLRADVACFQEVHGQERPGEPRALHALRALLAGTGLDGAQLVSTKPKDDGGCPACRCSSWAPTAATSSARRAVVEAALAALPVGGRLPGHGDALAQLGEGLPVALVQQVEQVPPGRITQGLEHQIHTLSYAVNYLHVNPAERPTPPG
jgi:hypothetical protein